MSYEVIESEFRWLREDRHPPAVVLDAMVVVEAYIHQLAAADEERRLRAAERGLLNVLAYRANGDISTERFIEIGKEVGITFKEPPPQPKPPSLWDMFRLWFGYGVESK